MRRPQAIKFLGFLALLITSGVPTASFAADGRPGATSAGPHVIDTISLPGAQPVALAFYEAGNKLFVSDEATGNLLMIDGSTRQIVSSVFVGHRAFELVVNETFGKVYVGSSYDQGGTGLISVINAATGALITQIDPAPGDAFHARDLRFAGDEAHDRVYISLFCSDCPRLGVIDAATNQYTPVPGTKDIFFGYGDGLKGVNTVTNEAFAVGGGSLYVINGGTLQVSSSTLPHDGPTDFAVNEVDNKLYFFLEPIGAWSGLLILDRTTGVYTEIEHPNREGTEPLVFNQQTDTLFSGATVNGTRGIIVDGATNHLTYVNFRGDGMGAGAVRLSTDNAYFASTEKTFAVNGSSKLVESLATGHGDTEGGFVLMSIAIDQARGLVYVVNDYQAGVVKVIQDGVIVAPPPLETTITKGPSGRTRDRTPTFAFTSTRSGATFKCKLDNGFWNTCSSPKTYGRLGYGAHTFRVQARDGPDVDPTPAVRTFTIVRT